jgi:putative ABC transport system permease protein
MLSDMLIRVRAIFRRKAVEGELEEELRFHLERQVEKYVQGGMSREEAQRRARLEFGGIEQAKEECRDARGTNFVESLLEDLRFGLRMLRKNPGFTVVAVLTLALGIGANTAIFSVVNGVLLHPLPYADSQQLVQLHETSTAWGPGDWGTASGPDFEDWRAQSRSFSGLAAGFGDGLNLTGGSEPQRIRTLDVSADFFVILGAKPDQGRLFDEDDFKPGAGRVVVLSFGLWRRIFGADPSIVGKSLTLSGQVYTVAGVTSQDFVPLRDEELWAPLILDNPTMQDRGSHWLEVIGRLKPKVSLAAARADLDTIAARLRKQYPGTNSTRGVRVDSLEELRVANVRPALLILLAAVGFVLLMACVNVGNLLLARGSARRKEMAVRAALGARRGRLVRQLLTESVTLAVVSAALGLGLAWVGTPALLAIAPENMLRSAGPIHIGGRVLLFTATLSLLTGLLFGLAPALQSRRVNLSDVLKETGGRSGSAGAMLGFRSSLVVFEIASATVLLVGGGLMIRSFASLLRVAPGFDPHNVLSMQLYMPNTTTEQVPTRLASIREMLHRIQGLPGVISASSVVYLPFSGNNINGDFAIAGQPPPKPEQGQEAEMRIVSAGYLSTMNVPLLRGRDLSDQDDASGAHVAVINRVLADRYFPKGDAVGQSVSLWDGPDRWLRIVGIAADERQFGLAEPPRASVYFCMSAMKATDLSQFMPLSPLSFVVRTATAPANSAKPIVAAIHSIDADMPVTEVLPIENLISESLAQPRLESTLLGIFAALAVVLAAVGLYSVMAYVVSQSTQEIGIRMALGAQKKDVLSRILTQGTKLISVGVVAGIGAALGLTRLMSGLLFGVTASDPVTLGGVATLLIIVALAACYVPARRAMRVDPMVALRYE